VKIGAAARQQAEARKPRRDREFCAFISQLPRTSFKKTPSELQGRSPFDPIQRL
jgi:hypothetical protein